MNNFIKLLATFIIIATLLLMIIASITILIWFLGEVILYTFNLNWNWNIMYGFIITLFIIAIGGTLSCGIKK